MYRLNEIKAGRGNSGTPAEDFGGQWPAFPFHLKVILIRGQECEETLHRPHCAPSANSFKDERTGLTCTSKDCPGIEPDSMKQHPPINTLLSIPFSLFSNPRLISFSSSTYVPKGPRQNVTESMVLGLTPDNKPAHIRDRTDKFEAMRPPNPLSCDMKDLQDAMQDMLEFQRSSPAQDLADITSVVCQVSHDGMKQN